MVSVPEFLVATLAVLVFAVQLRWLPALSYAERHRLARPSAARLRHAGASRWLSSSSAQMIRMTRAAVIEHAELPYIEMARLKGASALRIVLRHALPNALGPIANAVALSLSYLLGGVIIVETIFNYPGIAKLMVDGVAHARHAAGAGLRDDLLRWLPAAGHRWPTSSRSSPTRGCGTMMRHERPRARRSAPTPCLGLTPVRPRSASRPLGGHPVLGWSSPWSAPLLAPHPPGDIVDDDLFRPDQPGRIWLRHRLSRPRHALAHPGRRALHRRHRARRRHRRLRRWAWCWRACRAAVIGGWLDAMPQPLARRADTPSRARCSALSSSRASAPSIPVLILTLGRASTRPAPTASRARSRSTSTRMDFVPVARARGEGSSYLMRREILPNIVGPMLADFGLRFVFIVLLLAA